MERRNILRKAPEDASEGLTVSPVKGRVAHMSPKEKATLRSLVYKHKNIVENRCLDGQFVRMKAHTWDKIALEYCSSPGILPRSSKQLKKAWENMKTKARREAAAAAEENGSSVVGLSADTYKTLAMIGETSKLAKAFSEGFASSSGASGSQSFEDQYTILPNEGYEEEDGLVVDAEEIEEKYHPPVDLYAEPQPGTSEATKRGHEPGGSPGAKRGRIVEPVLTDEMIQEEMIPEEVTVTPHIPTNLGDSSSSNSSGRIMTASPASGRTSPDMIGSTQSNGVQRPPVCDSPVFLKHTNPATTTYTLPASTTITNGSVTIEPKSKNPRLFPYGLPSTRLLANNMEEQELDAEERKLVLDLEKRRLNLEERRLQLEEKEKNRRYALDEKRLQMEEEDRKRARMMEKRKVDLEERRVVLMEKRSEPEIKHWNMMDSFMKNALGILSQIVVAVEKMQSSKQSSDTDSLRKNLSETRDIIEGVTRMEQDVPECSDATTAAVEDPPPKPRKRKRARKRRNSNTEDEREDSSSDSGSETDSSPKFSEEELTTLVDNVDKNRDVLLAKTSDQETVTKKKSTWESVAECVNQLSSRSRTGEDVRHVWLSLKRKSRRKCKQIGTSSINLTPAERNVIRILSTSEKPDS